MRHRLFSVISLSAVILSASGSAFAADMAVRAPSPPPPAPVPTWTGFYVGAAGGYAWGDVNVSEAAGDPATAFVNGSGHQIVDPASLSFNANGGLVGIEVGYNWQFNQAWVAGIEADINWADIKGSSSGPVNMAGFGPNFGTFNASEKVDWFGTVRGRLGWLATPDVLLFATGGLAYGKVDRSASVAVTSPGTAIGFGIGGFSFACQNPASLGAFANAGPTCFTGSHSQTSTGWTVGGGLEYQYTRNLTFKVEYLYVNLGSDTFNSTAVTPLGPGGALSFLRTSFSDAAINNVLRAGVNWRF